MQILIIATTIVASVILIISLYAFWVTYKVNKLEKEHLSLSNKFCQVHLKQFSLLLIISILLFIGDAVGYALLVVFYNATLSHLIFPLIALFVSLYPLIFFLLGCIVAKRENKKYKESRLDNNKITENSEHTESNTSPKEEETVNGYQEEFNDYPKQTNSNNVDNVNDKYKLWREELLEKRNHNIEMLHRLKENSPALIKKYAYTVENLIDKLTQIHNGLFINMFNQSYIPLSSILAYPYRIVNSPLLKNAIKKDGIEFDDSEDKELNTGIYNIIEPYIEKLKEEIFNNNEWTDESTLPLLIYKIIRNNVIKHYHDTYLSKAGYESLEEFCLHIPNPVREEEIISYSSGTVIKNKILKANNYGAVWFIYYYIYEHDIDLPFVDTYKKLCEEMQLTIEKQKAQKKFEESEELKKELFGSHKVKNEPIKNTVRYVSPIEKVDNMTGEQFELFMTQYFAEHGFKATHTPLSGDFGIDLILENDFGKIGVQAKCYSKKVSQDAIREVVAGLKHYGLSSGMVVTNNYFQPAAIQLAKDNNVTLWDRNMLIKKLGE